jgi:hypothetical protein
VYVCVIFDHTFAHIPVVFDPRITYEGLKLNFINEPILLADLDKSKSLLHEYYNKYYAASPAPSKDTNNVRSKSSSTLDFTARYESIVPDTINELEEYLKIKHKHFKRCNPLRWWRSQRKDWPNLYHLACDILCIPGSWHFILFLSSCLYILGSAIAVEHIFSSGRDIISIRHASLQPETIHTLMVLKHHLHWMHEGDTIILE